VPRAASLAELNQMLADADEVDEHRRIAARIETVGQAAAREVPLLNPLPGNAFQAAAALSCRVDAKGDDLCPAVVLFGAGPARRPPGCKVALGADWIDVRHDGGSGRPAHPITAQGQREPGVGPPTWRSSCTPAGCVGRCHRPGQCPGRPACSPMGTNGSGTPHAARPGPQRHQGADRGAAAAPHPAHRGGARRDRRSGGWWCSLKFGTGVIRAGVGDPGASFVTPSPISCHRTCPQGSPPEPICGRTPHQGEASFADRAWSSRGRPGVVPESSRDGIWGVVFGAVMGFAAPGPPFLGVGGWINPSPGRDHQLLAPRGIPPIPGARSNRHRGAISS